MGPLDAREIYMVAPKGFRPSDWVERLMNWDECAELGTDLVYPKYTPNGEVLAVRTELLDPSHPDRKTRMSVFSQLMKFAKDNGHMLTVDPRLESQEPPSYQLLADELKQRGLSFQLRAAEVIDKPADTKAASPGSRSRPTRR